MVVAVLLTWFGQTRIEPPSVLNRSAPVTDRPMAGTVQETCKDVS
jgi:hypothetical protein